jgi:hypothetical protein
MTHRQRARLNTFRAGAILAMTVFTLSCWWAIGMLVAYGLELR